MSMDLLGDDEGYVYFKETLFAFFERAYTMSILQDLQASVYKILEKVRNETIEKIIVDKKK